MPELVGVGAASLGTLKVVPAEPPVATATPLAPPVVLPVLPDALPVLPDAELVELVEPEA